jgi:hypothetical protein
LADGVAYLKGYLKKLSFELAEFKFRREDATVLQRLLKPMALRDIDTVLARKMSELTALAHNQEYKVRNEYMDHIITMALYCTRLARHCEREFPFTPGNPFEWKEIYQTIETDDLSC